MLVAAFFHFHCNYESCLSSVDPGNNCKSKHSPNLQGQREKCTYNTTRGIKQAARKPVNRSSARQAARKVGSQAGRQQGSEAAKQPGR